MVTLAEVRFGIELVADANKRAELGDWLTNKVRPMFDQRILPITDTFSQPDLIIAATAIHHGLTILTRDRKDYDKARAPVMNPGKSKSQEPLLAGFVRL